jgi:Tissue inhibitor of metalloproteinase
MKANLGKLILFSFVGSMLISYSVSYACSCATPSLKEAVKESKAVFSGEVVRIDSVQTSSGLPYKVVLLKVIDGWKGVDKVQVTVSTAEQGEACGYHFVAAKKYLVFAHSYTENQQINVSLCSRTKPLEDAVDDLKKLGRPKIKIIRNKRTNDF